MTKRDLSVGLFASVSVLLIMGASVGVVEMWRTKSTPPLTISQKAQTAIQADKEQPEIAEAKRLLVRKKELETELEQVNRDLVYFDSGGLVADMAQRHGTSYSRSVNASPIFIFSVPTCNDCNSATSVESSK